MSEREKFEAWFKTTKHWKTLHEYIAIHEPHIKTVFCKSGKKYRNDVVDASWQTWQAARADLLEDMELNKLADEAKTQKRVKVNLEDL